MGLPTISWESTFEGYLDDLNGHLDNARDQLSAVTEKFGDGTSLVEADWTAITTKINVFQASLEIAAQYWIEKLHDATSSLKLSSAFNFMPDIDVNSLKDYVVDASTEMIGDIYSDNEKVADFYQFVREMSSELEQLEGWIDIVRSWTFRSLKLIMWFRGVASI